jgi:sulfatase modifying factor 1
MHLPAESMIADNTSQKPSCCAPSQEDVNSGRTVNVADTAACDGKTVPAKSSVMEPADEMSAHMVLLSGGVFLMGTDDEQGFAADGEGPVREVTIVPFWMDRTPVTNETFTKFITATGYLNFSKLRTCPGLSLQTTKR